MVLHGEGVFGCQTNYFKKNWTWALTAVEKSELISLVLLSGITLEIADLVGHTWIFLAGHNSQICILSVYLAVCLEFSSKHSCLSLYWLSATLLFYHRFIVLILLAQFTKI